jgi:hypothetical protein
LSRATRAQTLPRFADFRLSDFGRICTRFKPSSAAFSGRPNPTLRRGGDRAKPGRRPKPRGAVKFYRPKLPDVGDVGDRWRDKTRASVCRRRGVTPSNFRMPNTGKEAEFPFREIELPGNDIVTSGSFVGCRIPAQGTVAAHVVLPIKLASTRSRRPGMRQFCAVSGVQQCSIMRGRSTLGGPTVAILSRKGFASSRPTVGEGFRWPL